MDYNPNNNEMSSNEPWEWQGDEYYLQKDSRLDISHCLWDEVVNQNEDDLTYMFDETTPIKACTDFDYHVLDSGENMNKELEECRESFSQSKRRRMLQFNYHSTDSYICDEEIPSAFVKSKDREDSLMEDALPETLQWVSSFSEGCTSGNEGLDQSSEGWLANCFNENELRFSSDELNVSGVSDDQVDITEFGNVSPEMENDAMTESATPAPRILFKGRKSYMRTPTKLATSIVYPFALIKPCGAQGDVTLKDINQRIRTPSKLKHKDEDLSPSYPTSAFSGKPVVNKTKIRTEGGKGSITIMRTKG